MTSVVPVPFRIELVAGEGSIYEVRTAEGSFRWKPMHIRRMPALELAEISPLDAGFLTDAPASVAAAVGKRRIEVKLPAAPVAAMKWEELSPHGVVRRVKMAAPPGLPAVKGQLKVGLVNFLKRRLPRGEHPMCRAFQAYGDLIELSELDVDSLEELERLLRENQ